MKVPGSAADTKPEIKKDDEIMVIVKDQQFRIPMAEALSLAGTITAIVAARLQSGK